MTERGEVQPKIDSRPGDAVVVHVDGVEGKPRTMVVDEVGEKKVILRVGKIQLTEQTITLKPETPQAE